MRRVSLCYRPATSTPFRHSNTLTNQRNNYGDFADPHALNFDWQTRKLRLLHELIRNDATVLTVQECDHFHDWFLPALQVFGYTGLFCPKSNSSSQLHGWYPDGVALFWKRQNVVLKDTYQGLVGTGNPVVLALLEVYEDNGDGFAPVVTKDMQQKSEENLKFGAVSAEIDAQKQRDAAQRAGRILEEVEKSEREIHRRHYPVGYVSGNSSIAAGLAAFQRGLGVPTFEGLRNASGQPPQHGGQEQVVSSTPATLFYGSTSQKTGSATASSRTGAVGTSHASASSSASASASARSSEQPGPNTPRSARGRSAGGELHHKNKHHKIYWSENGHHHYGEDPALSPRNVQHHAVFETHVSGDHHFTKRPAFPSLDLKTLNEFHPAIRNKSLSARKDRPVSATSPRLGTGFSPRSVTPRSARAASETRDYAASVLEKKGDLYHSMHNRNFRCQYALKFHKLQHSWSKPWVKLPGGTPAMWSG